MSDDEAPAPPPKPVSGPVRDEGAAAAPSAQPAKRKRLLLVVAVLVLLGATGYGAYWAQPATAPTGRWC